MEKQKFDQLKIKMIKASNFLITEENIEIYNKKYSTKLELLEALLNIARPIVDIFQTYEFPEKQFKELHNIASLNLMKARRKILYIYNNQELVTSIGANNTIYAINKNNPINNIEDLAKNIYLILIQRQSNKKLDFIGALGGLAELCEITQEELNEVNNPKIIEELLKFDNIKLEKSNLILIIDKIEIAKKNLAREEREELGELRSFNNNEQLINNTGVQLVIGNDLVYDDKLILNNYGIDFFKEPKLIHPYCFIKEISWDQFNLLKNNFSTLEGNQEVKSLIFPNLDWALKAYGINQKGISLSDNPNYNQTAYKYRHEYAAGVLALLGKITKESGLYPTEKKRQKVIIDLLNQKQAELGSLYKIDLKQLAQDLFYTNTKTSMTMLDKTCFFPDGTISVIASEAWRSRKAAISGLPRRPFRGSSQ